MRSFSRSLAASLVVLSMVAACSDSTSVPSAPSRALSAEAPVFDFGNTGHSFGISTTDFALTASGGSFSVAGLYTVTFPENSVCDPTVSTYGPSEWNAPCQTLRSGQTITVHAQLSLAAGGLAVDFSPALRFSPASQVTISTDIFAPLLKWNRDYFLSHPGSLNNLAIYYAPSLGSSPVQDFGLDQSVTTHVNLTTGVIWRRIKHFSGYNVTSGQACDPQPGDPDCVQIDAP
jgi:hypothetical protein